MNLLHPTIRSELLQAFDKLSASGALPSGPKVQSYLDAFRSQFAPEVLGSMDGVELLRHLHAMPTKASMTYWMEFKDDDEFRDLFGSITGGSSLKYGVYLAADQSGWKTKESGPAPVDISERKAVEIARRHRDQLVAAADLVAQMPADGDDARYLRLQTDLQAAAPEVGDTVWAHKYLALLYPNIIDSFHSPAYQQYHATRLLQLPSGAATKWPDGRYALAGRFVAVARELNRTLIETAHALRERHGAPRRYWRVGTTDDMKQKRKYWQYMKDLNVVAIGWDKLGDLSGIEANDDSRKRLSKSLDRHYEYNASLLSRNTNQIMAFLTRIASGDRVVASDGQTVLGIGEVEGGYSYYPSHPFPHQRPVSWKSFTEWKPHFSEGLLTTVAQLKDPRNLVEIERRILDDSASIVPGPGGGSPTPPPPDGRVPLPRLVGFAGDIQSILERKGQAILYGPPGTGKTYWAVKTAHELAALRRFGAPFAELSDEQRLVITEGAQGGTALVRITSFHPEYGYEDFIEGYRPYSARNDALGFTLKPGTFRILCADALKAPELDFYLIVDEINRGDVPRIFGELLTLLEKDKRGQGVTLPASGDKFRVPSNVFVIGTMNTADRSIALLDVALRRRFGFVELAPDYSVLDGVTIGKLPLGQWLRRLNEKVRKQGGGDGRNRQVGHAFFLGPNGAISTVDQFSAIMRDDIVPLLEEYAYDSFQDLVQILGAKLVDVTNERVRRELFAAGRGDELIESQIHAHFEGDPLAAMNQETSDAADSEEGGENEALDLGAPGNADT